MSKPILLLSALALSACTSVGQKNVEACQDWIAASSCGDTDFSGYLTCSDYESLTCDISGYFDCLTVNTTCDESTGTVDTSGWGSCAEETTCQ